ncbi:hypothetical protein D3C86_1375290 [compost metagenome]
MERAELGDADLAIEPFGLDQIGLPGQFKTAIDLLSDQSKRFARIQPKGVEQGLEVGFKGIAAWMRVHVADFKQPAVETVELDRLQYRGGDDVLRGRWALVVELGQKSRIALRSARVGIVDQRRAQDLAMRPQRPKDPRRSSVIDLAEQAPQTLRLRAAIALVDRSVDIDVELAYEELGERPVGEVEDIALLAAAKNLVDQAKIDGPQATHANMIRL